MTNLTGRFKRSEETDANGKTSTTWAAGATVTISLLDGQEVALSKGGPVLKEFPPITFALDCEGNVPEDTEITGSDKLWPEGILYEISIYDEWDENSLANVHGYRVIEGTEVDLSALELDPFRIGARVAYDQPRPIPFPLPTPVPMQRTPLSSRKAGINYHGFYAVTIAPPAVTGTCVTPDIARSASEFGKGGEFCIAPFTLSLPAVVGSASIKIETPQFGHRVLVALYDHAGKRVCSTKISTDKPDEAKGDLERELPLKPGEYLLAWAGSRDIRLRSLGENQGQFHVGTISVPVGTTELPEKIDLTQIRRHSSVPPLIFLG
jgi:hypothetical protein